MRGSLTIGVFSVMIRKMRELICRTYKNDIDMKRCMDGMKEIALPKQTSDMGDNGVTPSQDLVDAKIFEYQICEYLIDSPL